MATTLSFTTALQETYRLPHRGLIYLFIQPIIKTCLLNHKSINIQDGIFEYTSIYIKLDSRFVLFEQMPILQNISVAPVEDRFHYVPALSPIWMSMCVHEVGECLRRMQRILMGTEKEPWRKPICYLYRATPCGAKLPLTVMHSKSDWLVCYWDIVRLNGLHSPKWWNYCTLVFESIIAD